MTVTGGNDISNFLRHILRHSYVYCVPDELFPYENYSVSVRSYRQLPSSGTKYNKFARIDELRYHIFKEQTMILIYIYVGEQMERETLGRRRWISNIKRDESIFKIIIVREPFYSLN